MRKSDLENFKALLQERKAQITKNIIDSSNEIAELRQSGVSDEFDIASVNADQLIEQSINAQQRQELTEIRRLRDVRRGYRASQTKGKSAC